MTLRSIVYNECWRSQSFAIFASAQTLCRNCLSRRFPAQSIPTGPPENKRPRQANLQKSKKLHIRHSNIKHDTLPTLVLSRTGITFQRNSRRAGATSTATATATRHSTLRTFTTQIITTEPPRKLERIDIPVLVTNLRKHIHHPHDVIVDYDTLGFEPSRVTKHLFLRYRRLRVRRLYDEIRKARQWLSLLSTKDFDSIINLFTIEAEHRRMQWQFTEAIKVLKDLSKLESRYAMFKPYHAEILVRCHSELGQFTRAEEILRKLMSVGRKPAMATYEALISCLATSGNMVSATAWFKSMEAVGVWPPSKRVVAAMVQGWLQQNSISKAAQVVREYDATGSVKKAIEKGMDDHAILDIALDRVGIAYVKEYRLESARTVYLRKQALGLDTKEIVSQLLPKALYTYQTRLLRDLVQDAIICQDLETAQLIARKMLHWCLARERLKHAMLLWRRVKNNATILGPDEYVKLLEQVSAAKYHEDLYQLYQNFKDTYPSYMTAGIYDYTLTGLTRSKQYDLAIKVFDDLKSTLAPENVTRSLLNSLYGLCAQTGDMKLYEQVHDLNLKSDLNPDYKSLNALMACCLTKGDTSGAMQTFDLIAERHGPDVVDFNLLLRATIEHKGEDKKHDKILQILKHMQRVNVSPDASTYRTILKAYIGSDMERNLIHVLLNDPTATKYDKIFINNIALTLYIERRGAKEAAKVFLSRDRRKLVESELKGYVVANSIEADDIEADGMTYKILLDALVKDPRSMLLAQKIYDDLRRRGWKLNRPMYHQMMLGWVRKDRIKKARKIMQDMEFDLDIGADLVAYTILIKKALRTDHASLVHELLEETQKRGLVLDEYILERLHVNA